MKKFIWAILPLLLLLGLPFFLREKSVKNPGSGQPDELVIVTPHTEMIKSEFDAAFRRHYQEKYGKDVRIDYRNMGGTSDILRYINDQYELNFRRFYEKNYNQWNDNIAANFTSKWIADDNIEAKNARQIFLNSNVGIGIDLFFGGGTFDHLRQADKGFGVDGKVFERHPEYFNEEIIPYRFAGEIFYDKQGRYYGVCLSSFGICYNPDQLKECAPDLQLKNWDDLGRVEFFNKCIIADPTKSGSVTKCYESLLQQKMHENVQLYGEKTGIAKGWEDGFNLLKRLAANSCNIADSAGKVTGQVANGNGALGISIDFYTLSESEYSQKMSLKNLPKIHYLVPENGSAVSADPIQLLRGAPNRLTAERFIDFCLSLEGQKLWNFKVGSPGGPLRYALRRPPIRQDLYRKEYQICRSDPEYNPYEAAKNSKYNGTWTGRYFNLIRILIRCTMLDVHEELQSAWLAIIEAGGPEKVPQAMAAFNRQIVPYENAAQESALLYPSEKNTDLDIAARRRKWSSEAIKNYQEAKKLAGERK